MRYASLIKPKIDTSRHQRVTALRMFLADANRLGIRRAWLVGSMASNMDHSKSDVDICIEGNFKLEEIYSFRDGIYQRTGVIIQLILDSPFFPKVRLFG